MWHWSFNRISCQDALCIKLRRGDFSTCLPIAYIQTSNNSWLPDICLPDKRSRGHVVGENEGFCRIWLHCAPAHWMTQQENQPDSTRHQLGSTFFLRPTYMNLLLLLLLCASSVYFYTCLCQYQSAEVRCETFNFICVSCMSLFVEERKINMALPSQVFNPFLKGTVKEHCSTWPILFLIQTNFRVLEWISAGSFYLFHGSTRYLLI